MAANLSPPRTPETDRAPSYRDAQLTGLMKELRAAVKPLPTAGQALARVEHRLRFVLRVTDLWDKTHAERARTLIQLGNLEAANTSACLIFDAGLRADLLRLAPIKQDTGAGDRLAEAAAMGREVLS